MKICKCGCGQAVKGHWDHGDHGKFVLTDYLCGHNKSIPTEETRQKLRDSHKGKVSPNKGKTASAETRIKLRLSHLGQCNRAGYKHKPESIEKMRLRKIGKKASQETKDKMRNTNKAKWESSEYAKKMIKSWKMTPNKKERELSKILESMYPGEWKFVGDGQIIIAGKCPDFINVNGKKKIIELFGDYWHKGENPKGRADIFRPFGYDTLVIWEHELKHKESMRNRIERFYAHEN